MPVMNKRKCNYCGNFFEPEFGRFNVRYCSDICRDKAKEEREKKSREKNREKNRIKSKKHYHTTIKNNPEARKKFTEKSKKYREENLEKVKKTQQNYYQTHKKELQEKRRKWWYNRGKKLAKARREGKEINLLKRGRPRTIR